MQPISAGRGTTRGDEEGIAAEVATMEQDLKIISSRAKVEFDGIKII